MKQTTHNQFVGLATLTLALGGCASQSGVSYSQASEVAAPTSEAGLARSVVGLRQAQADGLTRSQILMRSGAEFLTSGDLEKAQQVFNTALKFDAKNAPLHFLNALTYHLAYQRGDVDSLELAQAGYRAALMHDPSMEMAYFQLGRLFADAKDYRRAKQAMALAVDTDQQSGDAYFSLAQVAFLDGDLGTAYWAVSELERLPWRNPLLYRLKALLAAVTGQGDLAQSLTQDYAKVATDVADVRYLVGRVQRLLAFQLNKSRGSAPSGTMQPITAHPQSRTTTSAAASGEAQNATGPTAWFRCDPSPGIAPPRQSGPVMPSAIPPSDESVLSATLPAPCAGEKPQMAMFEVTMIRATESNNRAFGINLLEGLAAVLTNKSASTFSSATGTGDTVQTRSLEFLNSTVNATTNAVRYSLNIANAAYGKNEVLSRPTIAAIDRVPAVFFAGANLTLGIAGTGGAASTIVDKPIGVSLSVTPTFVDANTVLVSMRATRSFIETGLFNNPSVLLQQTRNTISASALLNFGDTYVLGGLVEKESDANESGTPVLKDVPLLQYLFKRSVKSDFNRQILTLITVRKVTESGPEDDHKPTHSGDIATHQMSRKVTEFLASNKDKATIEGTLAGLPGGELTYQTQLRARDAVNLPMGVNTLVNAMKESAYF